MEVLPDKCDACHARLQGRDKDAVRHQVVHIPLITPEVIEYRLHAFSCGYGTTTRARLPAGVPRGAFVPRLSAMVSLCTTKYRLSKRAVREFLAGFLGVELSLGSVAKVEQHVSAALEPCFDEGRQHVQQSYHAART